MKVLWITGNFLPLLGGLERYTDRAVGSLAALCDIYLITQHEQGPPTDPRVQHAAIPNLSRPRSQSDWLTARTQLRHHIQTIAPDLVHFANAGVAVYRDALPPGLPALATVHGNDLTAPWQWVPGSADVTAHIVAGLNGCQRLFAVSTHTQHLIADSGVHAPTHVVTAGCDTDFFRPLTIGIAQTLAHHGIPSDRPILLTVGRLVERKGHRTILEALALLKQPVHWVIVGDGPLRPTLQAAVARSQFREHITLLSHIPERDLLHLYNACTLFILTPEERHTAGRIDSEGFGLVFHEAGACAKPVIGSDISGCRDAVIDGATGLLVPPANPPALAAAIQTLLTNPGLASRLGTAARTLIQSSGGWSRFALQTLGHYREVLDAANEAGH